LILPSQRSRRHHRSASTPNRGCCRLGDCIGAAADAGHPRLPPPKVLGGINTAAMREADDDMEFWG
jgi:hypothetical protein